MKTKRTLIAATILFALGLFLTTTEASAQNVGKAKSGVAALNQTGTVGRHYVDADGDGICDNDIDKDGIPNRNDPDFVRPMDGTGKKYGKSGGNGSMNGAGRQGTGMGTGVCDGTGPKGSANRGGKK